MPNLPMCIRPCNQRSAYLEARGPVCECDNPRCFEALAMSWDEWEVRHGREPLIAPACASRGTEDDRG